MKNEREDNLLNPSVNRRTFLKVSGTLASATMASQVFSKSKANAECLNVNQPFETGENCPDEVETAEDIIYSVCQMCHSRCGIRAKVQGGILVKIDGNPYHPNNRDVEPDRLNYSTDPDVAVNHLGRVCLKGQAGIQTVYDPFRIQNPLKRVGSRNAGQWVTISWDDAFTEIAARINQLIPDRNALIDPSNPKLGKKKNQLAFSPGRSVEKEMSERIWKHAWGTANYGLSHTSVCESTRHVANELITWDPTGSKNSMGAGRSEGWQADILGADYIIYFGSNPLEAGFPMVGMARNLMHFKRDVTKNNGQGGKYVVVDPRLNNTAAQADQWVAIKPGTDAALSMGMMKWIIDFKHYDAQYLENTTRDAAATDGIPTWTDSTYLVGLFPDGIQRYINAMEVGISNGTDPGNDYVVLSEGELKRYDEVNHGDLDVSQTVNIDGVDIDVKSAFRLLKDSAGSKGIGEYETICGVQTGTIVQLASEFVNHGKKAVAMTYRGPVKHTNGLYNQLAIQHLNTLIGNYDFKGGCTAGAGGWGHKSGVVSLSRVNGDPGHEGIRIDRAKTFYNEEEAGNRFTGYPAERPWFPFGTHGNYQEVIPSIQDGYPYPIKALITYWNAMPYSVPALRDVWEETMADENKLPLLVSITPVMGEVAAWADYILPDSTYLEKFSVPGIPWRVNKGTSFQRPVVGKFDVSAIGDSGGTGNTIPLNSTNNYIPVLPGTKSVVDIHIGLAKALGLPGVGDGALLDDDGISVGNLNNSWDWAKAQLNNIANSFNTDHPNPPDIQIDEILSKGGVFDDPGDEYTPGTLDAPEDKLTYKYGNIIRTFIDPIARTRDSVTGEYYSGVPQYIPITHSDRITPVSDTGYPYNLITYKTVHHGQARTNVNPWLMLMAPENFVEINAGDAATLGIETGDMVNVSSASKPNGIEGKARVTQGLRDGVIAISHHYGHWEQHTHPVEYVPAQIEPLGFDHSGFDPSRGAGIQPTQIMRTDNLYPKVSLQEPIGASCSFYNTPVAIRKV